MNLITIMLMAMGIAFQIVEYFEPNHVLLYYALICAWVAHITRKGD